MASSPLRTSDIAKALGIHVNTVRNYERWDYLPDVPRGENGYRAFTAVHLEHVRLACMVLQWPYLGERTSLVQLVQRAARYDFGTALEMAFDYLTQTRVAQAEAETAVQFLEHWATGNLIETTAQQMSISQAAEHLDITIDMLRNWERNGLIEIPRQTSNQYRLYGPAEVARLRVIRKLIQSGYSLMAISNVLQQVDKGDNNNLRAALTLPPQERANEAIVEATARFLEKYFGLQYQGGNKGMAFLFDDEGLVLSLMKGREVTYPNTFHIGFGQPSEEKVNEINQRLREDGYAVPLPERHHAWTFYVEAPGGFTVEVLS